MLVFRNILRTYLVNDPYLTLRQILFICDALRDLVPFVQFKNLKNTHGGMFLAIKLRALAKWYQIAQRISYTSLIFLHHL